MQSIKSKIQQHAEIQHQIEEFLKDGGKISEIAIGISGENPLKGLRGSFVSSRGGQKKQLLETKKTPRHFLTKEVLAVEARRKLVELTKPTVRKKHLH